MEVSPSESTALSSSEEVGAECGGLAGAGGRMVNLIVYAILKNERQRLRFRILRCGCDGGVRCSLDKFSGEMTLSGLGGGSSGDAAAIRLSRRGVSGGVT